MRNHDTPLQAIRKECLDCSCYSPKQVRFCHITDCHLYPFRFGKNPFRKGIGRAKNFKSDKKD